MSVFPALSELKDCAPDPQLVECPSANGLCWDAVEEPGPAGMRRCSGSTGSHWSNVGMWW